MQRKFRYIFGLLVCLSLLAGPMIFASDPPKSPGDGVKWVSFQDGLKRIKAEDKKGFVLFYTDWCTYCKIMNKKTFTDQAVIDYLNKNYIPIRVNAEKERDVAKEYGVNRFPTTIFIAEDASTIGNRPGYIPADLMLAMLKYINTNSFKRIGFSDFMEKNH